MENSTLVPSRRRRRPPLACEPCRRKKIRCNRGAPCEACSRSRNEGSCVYLNEDGPRTAADGNFPVAAATNDRSRIEMGSDVVTPTNQSSSLSVSHDVALRGFNLPSPSSSISREPLNVGNSVGNLNIVHPISSEPQVSVAPIESRNAIENDVQEVRPTVRGNFSKTRFFGQSHWTNSAYQFYDLVQRFESDKSSETRAVYDKCKSLAKAIKAQEVVKQPLRTDINDHVPPRQIADQLIHAYFQNFETAFRILHVPSFLREYDNHWANPSSSSYEFVLKLLLVMAIGMVFTPERNRLRSCSSSPSEWIYTAQTWLSSPFEKNRINISGIQIYCLLLLARQSNGVGGDLIWISAGSLLRMAMHMGLHVDPSRLARTSLFDHEIRRRLWATVLEINVQSSTDVGGLPLVSMQDIDCELPSNFDDEQLDEGNKMTTGPVPRPADHYTGTSIQIALMKSLPVRLEIARYINDFKSGLSYNKSLQFSTRLSSICRANFELFQRAQSQTAQGSIFQVKLLELLTYRFLLTLHHPFAMKAKKDPTYYFSRKVSLEVSMSLLSRLELSSDGQPADEFTRLSIIGTGVFRDVTTLATAMVCDELILQIEEDKTSFMPMSNSFRSQDLRQSVEKTVSLLNLRIQNDETNVRGHLFFSCLLAQIDAMREDRSIEKSTIEAWRHSLDNCYRILRARADECGLDTPLEADANTTDGSMQDEILGTREVQDWFVLDEMMDPDNFIQSFI